MMHLWFSSITFERDSSPSSSKFHSALLSDQQFFDVANAKAAYRAANVFGRPSPMAQPFINCIREIAKPPAREKS
jgi:hypothetical protein